MLDSVENGSLKV